MSSQAMGGEVSLLQALQDIDVETDSADTTLKFTRGTGNVTDVTIPNSSTSQYGVVKLINSFSSTSTDNPPTAKALKDAYDDIKDENRKWNGEYAPDEDSIENGSENFNGSCDIGPFRIAFGEDGARGDSTTKGTTGSVTFHLPFLKTYMGIVGCRGTTDYTSVPHLRSLSTTGLVWGAGGNAVPITYLVLGEKQ